LGETTFGEGIRLRGKCVGAMDVDSEHVSMGKPCKGDGGPRREGGEKSKGGEFQEGGLHEVLELLTEKEASNHKNHGATR